MDSSLYIAYSGLEAEMRAVDVAAHNLANVSTASFREERSFISALESEGLLFPTLGGTRSNHQPGGLVATGRNLDVAIEGEGYLVVQTDEGRRYTRNGGLARSKDGKLVGHTGYPVIGQGGEIRLDRGEVEIDPEGRVLVSGVSSGRLLVVDLPREALAREDNGLYRLLEGKETPVQGARMKAGFLEGSNVDIAPVRLLEAQRHFQSLTRAIQVIDSLQRHVINTVEKR